MALAREEIDNNLAVFQKLLRATGNFYFWTFDEHFALADTNSPSLQLNSLFERTGCKAYLEEHMRVSSVPLILWSELGLLWFAAREQTLDETAEQRIHVVGPLNSAETVFVDRENMLKTLDISTEWKLGLNRLAKILPIMSLISLVPYALMLYQSVCGEKLGRSEVEFQKKGVFGSVGSRQTSRKDRQVAWQLEQAVLENIRSGNLNYQEDWDRLVSHATGVRVKGPDMLLRGKLSVVTFISLCVRAAVEGGLSPEDAYSRGDAYMEGLMSCTTLGDVRQINHTMYEDFVRRVHSNQNNPRYSRQTQSTCDFIQIHADEKLMTAELARRIGYSEYYFTRKFKEEVGISVSEYLKLARIERAKQLLTFSSQTIQEISDQLQFCSRSYFSEVFHRIVGESPAIYREQSQKL